VPQELSHAELAERAYGAWNDDDVEAMLALTHPEAQFTPSGVFPGMESAYRGEGGSGAGGTRSTSPGARSR
jgi:hypothetical protein